MALVAVQWNLLEYGEALHNVDGREPLCPEADAHVGLPGLQVNGRPETQAGHQVLYRADAQLPGFAELQLPTSQRQLATHERILPAALELPHPQLRVEVGSQANDRPDWAELLANFEGGCGLDATRQLGPRLHVGGNVRRPPLLNGLERGSGSRRRTG